jgi:hypothetical protein
MMTMKDLHFKHFEHNMKMIFTELLIDIDFARNAPITCLWYCEHKTKCFVNYLRRKNLIWKSSRSNFQHIISIWRFSA